MTQDSGLGSGREQGPFTSPPGVHKLDRVSGVLARPGPCFRRQHIPGRLLVELYSVP